MAKVGDVAVPLLRAALKETSSAEVKQRLEVLLSGYDDFRATGERLRGIRAVQALEAGASPEARALLDRLSRGAPASGLTREAKAALERLKRRSAD